MNSVMDREEVSQDVNDTLRALHEVQVNLVVAYERLDTSQKTSLVESQVFGSKVSETVGHLAGQLAVAMERLQIMEDDRAVLRQTGLMAKTLTEAVQQMAAPADFGELVTAIKSLVVELRKQKPAVVDVQTQVPMEKIVERDSDGEITRIFERPMQ